MPLVRGNGSFAQVDVRVAGAAVLVLVGALVLGWAALVPLPLLLVGGSYAAELAVDDAPLDVTAPAVAVALLLAAELSYWSLDERTPARGDAGQGLRRAALVALQGVAAFVVASALLALVDAVRTRGLAVDLIGAVAAAGVLATVLVLARSQSSSGS